MERGKTVSRTGGNTRNWTPDEKINLILRSRVRGYEGSHINSVSTNPDLAPRPDNVEFLKGRNSDYNEHLIKAHKGDWRNPTEGELLDRSRMIKNRVWFQSVVGEIGVTAIVFGVAFLAGTAISIAINRNRSFSYHMKTGLSTGGVSVVTYLSGRAWSLFTSPITKCIAEQLTHKFGEEVAKQLAGRLVFGVGASIALSIITLIKLRHIGHSWSYSLKQARNVFIVSIASIIIASFISALIKSALSGGAYGSIAGPAGIAAGIAAALIFTGIVLFLTVNRRNKIATNLNKSENDGLYLLTTKV